VTVGATVPANATAVTTAIPLAAAAGAGFDFPRQNAVLTDACFGANLATSTSPADVFSQATKVFKVDRYRFYVARNQFLDPDTGLPRPYLMLDQGLTDASGPILTPVAPDVEDLQFAYVLPTSAVPLVGATPSISVNNDATGIDLNVQPPVYTDTRASASRVTQSPANIRAVRVSVVVRSPETDITLPGKALATTYLPAAGNRPEIQSDPGNPAAFPDPYHWRALFETTMNVPNMASRLLYCGDYFVGAGGPGPNVGGG
jgi:type IV pilus assembly protein PilW